MIIIPAIDVYDNKVVRLQKGKFENITVYPLTPAEQAAQFAAHGFTRIHIIDLAGSKAGKPQIAETIRAVKNFTSAAVQTGGGLRTLDDVLLLQDAGADYFIIGSTAINNETEFSRIVQAVGSERIVLAADAKNGNIAIEAWQEITTTTLTAHIERCYSTFGIGTFLCTDINKDGMMAGPNISLYISLQEQFPGCRFIASGGISGMVDIKNLIAEHLFAAVVGKAIYEGSVTLAELKNGG